MADASRIRSPTVPNLRVLLTDYQEKEWPRRPWGPQLGQCRRRFCSGIGPALQAAIDEIRRRMLKPCASQARPVEGGPDSLKNTQRLDSFVTDGVAGNEKTR